VVAAAVVFPEEVFIAGLDDSKRLSSTAREALAEIIQDTAVCVGIGISTPEEIDRWNILQASLLAMRRAVEDLWITPDVLIVDGNREIPDYFIAQKALVKGDQKSASVAAASIIAKVHRDGIMREYHRIYPRYGFDRHKGYPSKAHREAIKKYGICEIHRRSFHIKSDT
jgi:ribonuclease HII